MTILIPVYDLSRGASSEPVKEIPVAERKNLPPNFSACRCPLCVCRVQGKPTPWSLRK